MTTKGAQREPVKVHTENSILKQWFDKLPLLLTIVWCRIRSSHHGKANHQFTLQYEKNVFLSERRNKRKRWKQ